MGTDELVFKAIQDYSDGTIVSWIQIPNKAVPDPLHPAPILQLTKGGGNQSTTATTQPTVALAATSTGGDSRGLSILALIVALFAVVVAGLAVWLGRPKVRSD